MWFASLPRRSVVAAVGCLAVLVLGVVAAGRGHTATGRQEVDPAKAKYFGAGYCKSCHEKGLEAQEQFAYSRGFVQLDEYRTWRDHDKHSQAHDVLTRERSRRMGELLGIDVTQEANCLACHAMNFPAERRGDSFLITDGVSCDGCHGPAEGWATPHSQQAWRKKSAAEKTKLGMIDVRDPVRRAELCLSCHVGNSREGKLVTHAMYAAGHPPLPGFEIDTFSDALPRHWRYLAEKPPDVQAMFGFRPDRLERVELVLVGSVVALREAARLAATQAATERSADFAQFDCYACHHELRQPSRRPVPAYAGSPGRPMPRPWPTALVELAVRHAAKGDAEAQRELAQLDERLRKLHRAFDARPFGEPAAVASAAADLGDWAGQLIEKLQSAPYDQAAARKLLQQLCSMPRTRHADCDSARQIAWVFRSLHAQLDPRPEYDAQTREILDNLDRQLTLTLLSGKKRQIIESLPRTLDSTSNYDPAEFQSQLDELRRLLPEAVP